MSILHKASIWSVAAAAVIMTGAAPMQAGKPDGKSIKLSGCLIRGEDGGYLLTNSPEEPAWQRPADATVVPSTVGTTGSVATMFYWLKDQHDLREHVGHLVEVDGDLDGDIEDGAIKIERKEQWTEIRVSSDGRNLKARVPHASVVSWPSRDKQEGRVLVRKVDVEHVRMLAAGCQR